MINLNYKASLFNGFSLEYSLCRYKYITLIIKDLKKINLSEKYIYNLLQRSLQDINYENDIILYKEKNLFLEYDLNILNKEKIKFIKYVFNKYTDEFNKESKLLVKYPSVILKPLNKVSKLIILNSTTNYSAYTDIIEIDNYLLIRLIKLYFICNKNNININIDNKLRYDSIINTQLSQCLIYIYHLLLLYKSINLKFNINKNSNKFINDNINYSILSTPLIKRLPFTYFSVFPFIEKFFGSLGFYKHYILIEDNTEFNLNFLFSKLAYNNIKIFKYKNLNIKLINNK